MWKRKLCFVICIIQVFLLCGCGSVRFSMGFSDDEFAVIGGSTVPMDRAYVILADRMKSYENVLDDKVWDATGVDILSEVKESVRETVFNLEVLKSMAGDFMVSLSEDDRRVAKELAATYCGEDSKYYNAVAELYADYILAYRIYMRATAGTDTEVSEDEARMINVSYVFISTMEFDTDGNPVPMNTVDTASKRNIAEHVAALAHDNKDFMSLVTEYSDDAKNTLTFGRGMYDIDFENAAFALESGQISDVVTTQFGFYIIKCTNDNVESDYDSRRDAIIEYRRHNAFAGIYKEYAEKIECRYNDEAFLSLQDDEDFPGKGDLLDIISTHLK